MEISLVINHSKAKYSRVWGSFDWLRDEVRGRGVNCPGGSGHGKSYCWAKGQLIRRDFFHPTKLLGGPIIDPTRSLFEYSCDELLRLTDKLPREDWLRVWNRIHYHNPTGTEVDGEIYITPNPFYRSSLLGESCFLRKTGKFPEYLRRIDPDLETASIEGFAALRETSNNVELILAPLGCQITEADSLIREPHKWKKLLRKVEKESPESAKAVAWVRELMSLKLNDRLRKTGSFLARTEFLRDPVQRVIFGANQLGVDPSTYERGHLHFFDTSEVEDSFVRMLSPMRYIMDFIHWVKLRGPKPEQPVLFVVDELTQLTRDPRVFAEDLQEIVNVIGRRYGIWSTFLYQSLEQLSPEMQSVMLSCNSHVFGACPHREAAITLGERFYPYRPGVVKHREPIYAGSPPEVIDYREVMYTPQEWSLIASRHFTNLKPWRFLVKGAQSEGDLTGELEMMNLEGLAGRWPNKDRVEQMRQLLALRDGIPMSQILAEIEQRQQQVTESGSVNVQKPKPQNREGQPPDGQQYSTLKELILKDG